jgi:putative inorganic carbon (hco3(-)) transporter
MASDRGLTASHPAWRGDRAASAAKHSVAVVGLVLAAVGSGALVATDPGLAAVLLGAGLAVAYLLQRPAMAVALVAVSSFFETYLSEGGLLTPNKLIGLLAAAAWGLAWLTKRYPLVLTGALVWPLGLLLWLLPSTAAAIHRSTAIDTSIRYVMFAGLYFMVLQVVRGERARADRLIDVVIAGAAISAAMGLNQFVSGEQHLASGPVADPNDFAFLLASVIPLVVYRLMSPRRRLFAVTAGAVLGLAVLASLSRGAVVGLAVAGMWVLLSGRVRMRWVAIAAAAAVVLAVVGLQTWGSELDPALEGKTAIAQENVDSRLTMWAVAMDQFRESPLLGVGPGNYSLRYAEHGLPVLGGQVFTGVTTHNTYLNILAELGLPGFLLFLAFVVHSWRLMTRPTDDPREKAYRTAVTAAYVVALSGAMFLTQQHFAPLWMLPALGALAAPVGRTDRAAQVAAPAP